MNKNTVNIVEVCPRDGFQNLENFIPTSKKLEIIEGLIAAGFKKIQTTSFVHPKAVPQMRDAAEIAETVIPKYPEVTFTALVPNLHGAEAAYKAGIREISYVISASESHNRENVRRTIAESFEALADIRKRFADLIIKIDIATAFGCPFEGDVPVEKVCEMIDKAIEIGVDDIYLADTIGVANPAQMGNVLDVVAAKYPSVAFGLHLHDTRGMGLANVVVALQKGFDTFESAAGGLGGCPFAPGAAGNIATEDLVNMLEQMGYETGIALEQLLKTVDVIKADVKSDLTGHLANICRQ
ncbi:hydroxymethylglutaryl-CoA lyase [Fusibacter paucivorans]|uniref:Hydroxymethylglutaryl-CoA lyase n=1 Tax=Fusibacter paucivorans TaxID=76009 RepID=A0ABS5PJ55_9FIRM|nr:hydroxymethylglutaryl-CoA lyase [Fusibacter paucivorans]MBS7525135.1 hydroxymethylglutaryl-CoA lyase [Fusibacter paucivorans]